MVDWNPQMFGLVLNWIMVHPDTQIRKNRPILAEKFKMEFLPTISLTKAFPVAAASSSKAAGNNFMQV